MAFFPTEEEAQGFVTIEAIAIWVGLNVLVIPAIEKHTGAFANMPRNLAMLPPVVIKEAVKVAKLIEADGEDRLLTPVEAAHVGLVWRITRRKLSGNWASWVDVDPFEAPSDPGAAPPTVKVVEASASGAKKLKMAHILDQGDESSFTLADTGHITVWFHNFVAITHGQPDEEETPTNEQLKALNVRVVVQLGSPVQTSPFSRFTRGRPPQLTASPPGERDSQPSQLSGMALLFEGLSCGVLSVEGGARDAFGTATSGKSRSWQNQWPTAWHLVCLAEDKCRFEHFNRVKSRISLGRAVPPMWDAGSPWSAIFLKVAEADETYWDDNIRHPAMSWLAHGVRGSPKAREHLVAEAALAGGMAALVPEASASPGAVNAWGQDTLAKAMAHRIKRERSAASTADVKKEAGRRKGGKEQRSALHSRPSRGAVVLQLEFRQRDVRRATAGKLMPCWQSSKNAPRVGGTSTRQGSSRRLD